MTAPLIFIDRVTNLSMTERLGVIRSLTREVRLIFKNLSDTDQTYNTLQLALDTLDQNGYEVFSTLPQPDYSSLTLTERDPKISENDPGVVDVTLKYEHILDGPNQQLINPTNGLIFGRGRSSIVQKKTNFFRLNGNPNAPRYAILTAYTYPQGDQRVVALRAVDPANLPRTVIQGGEVDLPFPQGNFSFQGVIYTENPWSIKQQFINCINDSVWLGEPAFTWICSEVQWDVLNVYGNFQSILPSYRFSFEFQNNPDGWNPEVVYIDPDTHRPPGDIDKFIAAATGYDASGALNSVGNPIKAPSQSEPPFQPAGVWQVPALKPVNFNKLFASYFEGFEAPGIS